MSRSAMLSRCPVLLACRSRFRPQRPSTRSATEGMSMRPLAQQPPSLPWRSRGRPRLGPRMTAIAPVNENEYENENVNVNENEYEYENVNVNVNVNVNENVNLNRSVHPSGNLNLTDTSTSTAVQGRDEACAHSTK